MEDEILLTQSRTDSRVQLLSEVEIVADAYDTAPGIFQNGIEAGEVVE